MTIALTGTTIERKASISSRKLKPEHEGEHDRRPVVDNCEEVRVEGWLSGHEVPGPRFRRKACGMTSCRNLPTALIDSGALASVVS